MIKRFILCFALWEQEPPLWMDRLNSFCFYALKRVIIWDSITSISILGALKRVIIWDSTISISFFRSYALKRVISWDSVWIRGTELVCFGFSILLWYLHSVVFGIHYKLQNLVKILPGKCWFHSKFEVIKMKVGGAELILMYKTW